MPIEYPARIALARTPTPLEPLDRLSRETPGPRIWVKRDDLTGSDLSGNKIRKLEFTLAEARAQGCNAVITCGGVQSNHCRATAIAGARLGMRVHLILRGDPEDVPDGNLLLDHLAGATISFHSVADFKSRLDDLYEERAEAYRQEGHKAFKIPMGASDEIGAWGYIAACGELKDDFARHGIAPAHIVCATGSGGTQAGLTAGSEIHQLGAAVWGINVCDNEEYFMHKVRSDLRAWKRRYNQPLDVEALVIRVIDGYVGPGYARATREIFDTIARVARTEGFILDPVYTGKAFHGLLRERERGRFGTAGDIVFIHTGGIFGTLAQRAGFGF